MNEKPGVQIPIPPLAAMVVVALMGTAWVYSQMQDGTLIWGIVSMMVGLVVGSLAGLVAYIIVWALMGGQGGGSKGQ